MKKLFYHFNGIRYLFLILQHRYPPKIKATRLCHMQYKHKLMSSSWYLSISPICASDIYTDIPISFPFPSCFITVIMCRLIHNHKFCSRTSPDKKLPENTIERCPEWPRLRANVQRGVPSARQQLQDHMRRKLTLSPPSFSFQDPYIERAS
jgi:hypothetical protein